MIKSVLREIKSSLGRYLSMLAIIALGSGFLSGLMVTKDTMVHTLDESMRQSGFYDWRLVSTLGYELEDVTAFRAEDRVRAAEGAVEADAICTLDGAELVMKYHSITDGVNTLTLKCGRMPENAGECVVDSEFFLEQDIGTVLRLSSENSEDTLDKFVFDEYTIVGVVSSPLYINYERGSTALGTGVVSSFVYIMPEGFDVDYYTEVYLTLNEEAMIYSEDYKRISDGSEALITELAQKRADQRYDRILSEANEEIAEAQEKLDDARMELDDGQREYDDGKAEADAELAEALAELTDAERKLVNGRRDYDDGVRELEEKVDDAEAEMSDAQTELAEAYAELKQGEREYFDAKRELRSGENDYADGLAQYEDGISQTVDAQKEIDDAKRKLDNALGSLVDGERELDGAKRQLDEQQAAFDGQVGALTEAVNGILSGAIPTAEPRDGDENSPGTVIDSKPEPDSNLPAVPDTQSGLTSDELLEILGGGGTDELTGTVTEIVNGILSGSGMSSGDLVEAKQQLDEGWKSYNSGASALSSGDAQYWNGMYELKQAERELDDAKKDLEKAKTELADARAELDDGWKQLKDARAELDDGWEKYNDGVQELADAREELAESIAEAEAELADARGELADAERKIRDGWDDYYEGKADAERELADARAELDDGRKKLADAEAELADAREELAELVCPEVYVLGRGTNIGYVCFESDADIIFGISKVFPLFFFLVAALVCITTMTRAVDEQRTQIGVLKALGFSSGSIMGRYMLYSGSAALIGCTLGFFAGSYVIPVVIWKTYQIMYSLGDVTPYFNLTLGAVSTLAYLAVSSAATYLACRHELLGAPAELLRPKPPKSGRRVFLEHVTFIWRRLSFLYKVSIRNIFRYRQRLFMMVLGIGGCTALLLTGYGIKNSIKDVVGFQYGEISLYEYTISFSDAQDGASIAELEKNFAGELTDIELVCDLSMDVDVNGRTKLSHVIAPTRGQLEGLVDLHFDGQPVPWPETGEAVICVNLAETFGLKTGDTITLRDEEMNTLTLTVSGIFENYVYNYIYVSMDTLIEQWKGESELKTVLANPAQGCNVSATAAKILDYDGVSAVSSAQEMRERIGGMMSSLDYIVWLIVLCSGTLAFIVLYNLTNININERIREIATIKVIGFYRNESSSYVFRENMMLTVLGALAGLPAGVLLHKYIISHVRVDMMYFKARIFPVSYLYAFGFTLLFAVIVDIFMYFRLERINMAEALKSIE